MASKVIVAATVLPLREAFNKTLLLIAPLAMDTFGVSVTGAYSVALAVPCSELLFTSVMVAEITIGPVPLAGRFSVTVIVLLALF